MIYTTLKVKKNTKKRAYKTLSSNLITEISVTPRQKKATRTEKLLIKAENRVEAIEVA